MIHYGRKVYLIGSLLFFTPQNIGFQFAKKLYPIWTTYIFYRLGRKFTMVAGTVIAVIINIIQSFSINYPMFLALEICASTIFSGVYAATFILGNNIIVIYQLFLVNIRKLKTVIRLRTFS